MPDLSEMTSKRRPVAQVWPLITVGGLGVAVAIAAWIAVSVWEERLAKAKFNDVARRLWESLAKRAQRLSIRFDALCAFYDASHRVDPTISISSPAESWPGNAMRWGLVWCPRVRPVRVGEVTAMLREGRVEPAASPHRFTSAA